MATITPRRTTRRAILDDTALTRYVEQFNAGDDEFVSQAIPNDRALAFLRRNIPYFDCPDKELELTYYFRWWTLRKHIRRTTDGYVFTEFLPPVPWAGKHNTISLASGLHIAESRWLRDSRYAEDYARFWFRGGGAQHAYTSWVPYAVWQLAEATGGTALLEELYPEFLAEYAAWETGFPVFGGKRVERGANGLFYTYDFFDGGEISVSGHGYRPLSNAAVYSSARTIARVASLVGDEATAAAFTDRAGALKGGVQRLLWNPERQFFMTRTQEGRLADVKELYGLSPWYFGLPDEGYAAGFAELFNPDCFAAPYGPSFTEQAHTGFRLLYEGHECQWNGPSWPYATSLVLGAMENLLNDYRDVPVTPRQYCDLLTTYASSQRIVTESGVIRPWIDENLNPYTGDWISRTRLRDWDGNGWCQGKGGYERGKDYNHSAFCTHVICGLVGLRPSLGDELVVRPLIGEKQWDWFCLDRLPYHGHILTIVWDKYGTRYPVGEGFTLLVDGEVRDQTPHLGRLTVTL